MADNYTCDECGEEFDSERGLHIHIGQVHGEEDEKEHNNKKEDIKGTEEKAGSKNFPVDKRKLQIPMELALFSVFVLGVAVGLSSGLLAAGSGLSLDPAESIMDKGDSPDASPSNQEGTDSGTSETVDLSKLETEGEPVLGQEDAPVTMVVYEDFQCPFCKRFETGAVDRVESEYVESGQVKIIWKDFALPSLGHDWAEPAAAAAECVYREGGDDAFYSVKEKIFDQSKVNTRGQEEFSPQNIEEKIKDFASTEGVSKSAVQNCIENDSPMDEVDADKQEGKNFNTVVQTARGPSQFVGGTPGSVIYGEGDSEGEPLVGAQPFSAVQSVIESKINS